MESPDVQVEHKLNEFNTVIGILHIGGSSETPSEAPTDEASSLFWLT